MDNHEFEDLGKKIQDIVDNAVNSNSYHELSHTINQTVNKAIDSGSEALKNAMNSVFEPGSDPQFRKRDLSTLLIKLLRQMLHGFHHTAQAQPFTFVRTCSVPMP